MTAKLLIVDDETDLLEILRLTLGEAGFIVHTAQTGAEALSAVRIHKPDLILLDIMLEDISGITLAGKLKNDPETAKIPIIMLTAKDSETDMVVGLSVGADDYVTKPFSTAVLIARMEAVLRRSKAKSGEIPEVIAAGAIKILPRCREVRVDGRVVELTGGEYNVLLGLVEAGGAILSREELKRLSGAGRGETERIVDVHISALRRKLGSAKNVIKTVKGEGYRIPTS
jgi:two-component system phosphate regulon response regulator PhoB